MAKPDVIVIDGHGYSWQQLCELRRQQLEAWKAAQPSQPALFELKNDCRPEAERTVAGRYREPSLFSRIASDPRATRPTNDRARRPVDFSAPSREGRRPDRDRCDSDFGFDCGLRRK
jgi:hypothetical protein